MAVRSYAEILEEIKKNNSAQENADIAAKVSEYDTNKNLTSDAYNKQIKETGDSYQDLYDENAVQRQINERQIAENMANLGLSNSGLNRTQQTAAQLSYANTKNKIDITRQKAIDTLTASLADAVAKLDSQKNSAVESIRSSYNSANQNYAQDAYNSELEAETERQKAYYSALIKAREQDAKAAEQAIKQSSIIQTNGGTLSRNFTGTLADNNVSVIKDNETGKTTYVDNNSGKKTVLAANVNPYTGTVNRDTDNGTFENGYQPNNVNGNALTAAVRTDGSNKIATTIVNGVEQKIWKAANGYYIWHGAANKYERMTRADCIAHGIYVDAWYDK